MADVWRFNFIEDGSSSLGESIWDAVMEHPRRFQEEMRREDDPNILDLCGNPLQLIYIGNRYIGTVEQEC